MVLHYRGKIMKKQNKVSKVSNKVLQESVKAVTDVKDIEKKKELKKVNIANMSLEAFRDLF